jgi:rhodanese-related sulfurtransferase
MNNYESKNTSSGQNRVIILGFGLILIVVSITILRPVLKIDLDKEEVAPEPVELYNDYEYITSKELKEKINKKEELVVIDIRDSVSYREDHIESSINITPEKIEEETRTLSKNKLLVIVGYNFEDKGAEAGAVKFFKDSEFSNVVALSGGIFAWKKNLNSTIGAGDPESSLDLSKIEEILPEQLKLAIENDYPISIIDTRSSDMFSQGHIPGALNITLDDLEKRKKEISRSKEIIVYGDSNLSDFQAGVKLHDLGFLASYIIKGGFASWQEKRFPIEK